MRWQVVQESAELHAIKLASAGVGLLKAAGPSSHTLFHSISPKKFHRNKLSLVLGHNMQHVVSLSSGNCQPFQPGCSNLSMRAAPHVANHHFVELSRAWTTATLDKVGE